MLGGLRRHDDCSSKVLGCPLDRLLSPKEVKLLGEQCSGARKRLTDRRRKWVRRHNTNESDRCKMARRGNNNIFHLQDRSCPESPILEGALLIRLHKPGEAD